MIGSHTLNFSEIWVQVDLAKSSKGVLSMKGHIRERSPGHWAIILDVPDPQTGKRRRKWHSFKGTKREAQIESARLISAVQTGTYLEPSKTTLAAYLDHWLDHIKSQVSP